MIDEPNQNGQPKTLPDGLPSITVQWDDARKGVNVGCDLSFYKNWDFVIANLELAISACKKVKAQQEAMQHMAMMQQAQRDQAIAQRLQGNR